MDAKAKKAAAGATAVTSIVLSFLLYANEQRAKESAEVRARLAVAEWRLDFFLGKPTLDEIKARAKDTPLLRPVAPPQVE